MPTITIDDLLTVDVPAGTILTDAQVKQARNPSCPLTIDFGLFRAPCGASHDWRKSYAADRSVGRENRAVVN